MLKKYELESDRNGGMLQTVFIRASPQSLTVGYCKSEFWGCINDVGSFYQPGGRHHCKRVSASWNMGIKSVCMASLERVIIKYYCA